MAASEKSNSSDVERVEGEMKERSAVEAPPPTTRDAVPETTDEALQSDLSWHYVAEDWQRLKGRIGETWPELTDDEVAWAAGSHDRFVSVITGRYGLEPAAAEEQLHTWLRSLGVTNE